LFLGRDFLAKGTTMLIVTQVVSDIGDDVRRNELQDTLVRHGFERRSDSNYIHRWMSADEAKSLVEPHVRSWDEVDIGRVEIVYSTKPLLAPDPLSLPAEVAPYDPWLDLLPPINVMRGLGGLADLAAEPPVRINAMRGLAGLAADYLPPPEVDPYDPWLDGPPPVNAMRWRT
jgi:hypothetical protein